MTRIEFDNEMARLQEEQEQEVKGLREQLHEVQNNRIYVKCTIIQLRAEEAKYGKEELMLSHQIQEVKLRYQAQKHELGMKRREEAFTIGDE